MVFSVCVTIVLNSATSTPSFSFCISFSGVNTTVAPLQWLVGEDSVVGLMCI